MIHSALEHILTRRPRPGEYTEVGWTYVQGIGGLRG